MKMTSFYKLKILRKKLLQNINNILKVFPNSFKLIGIPNGYTSIEKLEKSIIYQTSFIVPLNLKTIKRKSFQILLSQTPRKLKGGGLLFIENGIATYNGEILTKNEKQVIDLKNRLKDFNKNNLITISPRILPRVKYLDETIVALSLPEFNYYHWLFEILPTIHLIEKSNINTPKLYLNITHSVQLDTLNMLGYNKNAFIDSNLYKYVSAKSVIIPYFVEPIGTCRELELSEYDDYKSVTIGNVGKCVGVARWICDYLRENFLNDSNSAPNFPHYSRIYISRKDSNKKRCVKNEEEFIQFITKYGFKTLLLDGMSFKDQVQIFKEADVILAPHGAALTNIVFCKPGAKCIELFSPNYISDLYSVLSQLVNLNYYYLIGKGKRFSSNLKLNENIDIDFSELVEIFKLADIEAVHKYQP